MFQLTVQWGNGSRLDRTCGHSPQQGDCHQAVIRLDKDQRKNLDGSHQVTKEKGSYEEELAEEIRERNSLL